MPHVTCYVAMSLDGYIATEDGGVGWLDPFETVGEDYGYAAFYESVDGLLIGRRTYEQIVGFGDWPYLGKPCWIMSHHPPQTPVPEGVTVTSDSPGEVLEEIALQGIERVWLVGGAELLCSFQAESLVSAYVLSIMPVILGAGIPLFAGSGPTETVRLCNTESFATGVLQLRYEVTGL